MGKLFDKDSPTTMQPGTQDDPIDMLQPQAKPRTVFGFNGNVSSGTLTYQNQAFLEVITGLNTELMRWPGGKTSNEWDWQNGYRETQPKGNRNNLDDLKAVVDKTGCNVVWTLNVLTRPVEDQILMLQTAESKGLIRQDKPLLLEAGNEISNINSPGLAYFKNGTNYGKLCLDWSNKIKKVYPNAQIGVWAENKKEVPTWLQEILKVYQPDALVIHIYPNANEFSLDGIVNTATLEQMMYRAIVKSGMSGLKKPIWITESNILPGTTDILKSGQHKIALKTMLNYYASAPQVQYVCVHNIVGQELGAINYDLSLSETGLAFKEFKSKY